jgi:hypothetical protein
LNGKPLLISEYLIIINMSALELCISAGVTDVLVKCSTVKESGTRNGTAFKEVCI